MNKDRFHKLSNGYIDRPFIYREGRIVCCAQVNNIQLFDTEMQASLIVIPTLVFLPYSLTNVRYLPRRVMRTKVCLKTPVLSIL